jgi:hypothetical protein
VVSEKNLQKLVFFRPKLFRFFEEIKEYVSQSRKISSKTNKDAFLFVKSKRVKISKVEKMFGPASTIREERKATNSCKACKTISEAFVPRKMTCFFVFSTNFGALSFNAFFPFLDFALKTKI